MERSCFANCKPEFTMRIPDGKLIYKLNHLLKPLIHSQAAGSTGRIDITITQK